MRGIPERNRALRWSWVVVLGLLAGGCEGGVTDYNLGVTTYRDGATLEEGSSERHERMKQAVKRFEAAAAANPEFGEAYWNLALIQVEELNEPQKAHHNLEQALQRFEERRFVSTPEEQQDALMQKAQALRERLRLHLGPEGDGS